MKFNLLLMNSRQQKIFLTKLRAIWFETCSQAENILITQISEPCSKNKYKVSGRNIIQRRYPIQQLTAG